MPKEKDVSEEEKEVREVIVEKKSGFNYPEMVIIMIIALLFGFLLGNIVNFSKGLTTTDVPSELQELVSTYQDIVSNYYDSVDKEKLVDAGIKGMIEYLDDPYATYFEGSSSEAFNQSLEGRYNGIGIQVTKRETGAVITTVFANSPAFEAGLQVDDQLLKVAGEDVTNKELADIVALIKGENKTYVDITVLRQGNEVTVAVMRDRVDMPLVTSKLYEQDGQKIGYLKFEIFSSNIAQQFKNGLKELEKQGADRLVIDVRDNPGGYLTQVTEILSLFMDKKQVLYQLQTKDKKEKIYGTAKSVAREYPVVVIINEESASASEILAAAFKESYGASIVGVNSYGKGTVQKTEDLKNGDTIKYTFQKWLTPKGKWINKTGVTPTDKVELSLKEGEVLTEDKDLQLQRALTLLSKK